MAQARRTKKSKTPAWAWVLIGILLGFFFAHVNFGNLFQFLAKAFEQNQTPTTSTSNKKVTKQEPKFDFYNLLSEKTQPKTVAYKERQKNRKPEVSKITVKKMPVVKKEPQTTPKATQQLGPPPKTVPVLEAPHAVQKRFTVQVAALKGLNEADQLKAKLLILGFQEVNIRKRQKGSMVLYRVTIGNFPNRKNANLVQEKLKQKGIASLITKE